MSAQREGTHAPEEPNVFELAFQHLFDEISEPLFKNHQAISLKYVTQRYDDILSNMDKSATFSKLKITRMQQKLTTQFGDKLTFLPQTAKPPFLYASENRIGDAIAKLQNYQHLVNDMSSMKGKVAKVVLLLEMSI